MNITTTARHFTLPPSVHRRAETRIRRLQRYEPRLLAADVAFDEDHGHHHVEARLIVAGGPIIVARDGDRDLRLALDRTTDRLRRQLVRRRGRWRRARFERPVHRLAPAGEG